MNLKLERRLARLILATSGLTLFASEPIKADEYFEKATVEGKDYCIGSRDVNFAFELSANQGGEQQISGWPLDDEPWFGGYGSSTNGKDWLAIALSKEVNDVAFAYRVGTNNNLNIRKNGNEEKIFRVPNNDCLLYTSPSPRDRQKSRMPSSA